MKKLVLMVLALAAFASAQIGIGFDGTLGGVSGLSVQVPVTEGVFAQAIGGYTATETADDEFEHTGAAALRGWYVLAQNGPVGLLVGAGVTFKDVSNIEANTLALEIPLGVDYQFTENFSISGQTGVAVHLGDSIVVDAFQLNQPNWFGGFAFHAWL